MLRPLELELESPPVLGDQTESIINISIYISANYSHATRNFTYYLHATQLYTIYSHAAPLLEPIQNLNPDTLLALSVLS
jgi:hypothetical protein